MKRWQRVRPLSNYMQLSKLDGRKCVLEITHSLTPWVGRKVLLQYMCQVRADFDTHNLPISLHTADL